MPWGVERRMVIVPGRLVIGGLVIGGLVIDE